MSDHSDRLAFAALFGGGLCIAFSPILVRFSELGPVATAFYRIVFALPLFALWLRWLERPSAHTAKPLSRKDWLWLGLSGVCFAGDLAVWHWSLHYTTVMNATLLANLAPIFVTAVAWFVFKEYISQRFLLGLGLALIGVVVLVKTKGVSSSPQNNPLFGDMLGVITAMFYAGYILAVKALRSSGASLSTSRLMALSGVITAVLLLPMALLSGESLIPHTLKGWLTLIGLAWISQFAGQSLITYGLAHLPASYSSLTLLIQPAAAAALAWLLLNEPLGPWQIIGSAAVLAGILLARQR